MGKKVYGENGLPINSFAEACAQEAKSYIAGMDSAVRHSIKGDADSYLDKKSGTRSRSWNLGYEWVLRAIAKDGLPQGYSKDALGSTQHDAEIAFLGFYPRDYDVPKPKTAPRRKAQPKEPPRKRERVVGRLEKREPQPVEVTSSCIWYAEQVEGSRQAGKGKHAGMWYVSVA